MSNALQDDNTKKPPVATLGAGDGVDFANELSPAQAAATSVNDAADLRPDYDQSIAFLKDVYPGKLWSLTAINLENPKRPVTKTFDQSTEAECRAWLEDQGVTRNIYFSINEVYGRDVVKKAERKDITKIWWLHVDIDPRVGEDIKKEQQRALALLNKRQGGLPLPTAIVFSGGGYQAFWKLDKPIEINRDLAAAEDAKLYNLRIEQLLEGSDHCHNVDRIGRLPGTINRPDDRKLKKGRTAKLAVLAEYHGDRVYSIEQFAKAQADHVAGVARLAVPSVAPKLLRVEIDSLPPGVTDRCKVLLVQGHDPDEPNRFPSRSEWLFAAVCGLVRGGCDDQVIFSILNDSAFGISASVLDKGGRRESYALKQIAKAREVVAKDAAKAATAAAKADAVANATAELPELAELNGKHFVVGNWAGKCRIAEEVHYAATGRNQLTLSSFEDFRNRYANRSIVIGHSDKGPITKTLGDWWLKHPKRKTYQRVVFAPGEEVGPDTYNLWQGFSCEPKEGNCERFLAHMRDNICNGNAEHYRYLLGWLANAVQRPGVPGQVAVILRGGQGTGKSIFVKLFGSLFGRHYLRIADMKHLTGSFNAHLRDVVVLFADEAFYAGDKKARSLLKSYVTDDMLTIEAKGIDTEPARNCLHLLLASNDKWVVPAEHDDRRYFVLDVGSGRKRDSNYFKQLAQEMDNGGREALLHLLLSYDMSDFDVRDRPETEGLADQKALSLEPLDEWVYTLLYEGMLPNNGRGGKPNVAFLNGDDASVMGLYQHARQVVPKLRNESATSLGRHLGDWGATNWKDGSRGWEFPPLGEMRAAWVKKYGPQPWPGESAAEWRSRTAADGFC